MAALISEEHNEQTLRRFKRETKTLQQLLNPHIVEIISVGTISGTGTPPWALDCVLMPYITGAKAKTLIERQDRQQLQQDLPRLVRFGMQVALGAAAIHDHDSPHRDLSWNNVLVDDSPETSVIVDLGNVMDKDNREDSFDFQKLTPIVCGTPNFIAPEQHDGRPSPASDQFSLSVMLYRWCTGAFPYKWDQQTAAYRPAAGTAVRSIHDVCSSISRSWDKSSRDALRELSDIVKQGLDIKEDSRHPSMRHLAARLQLVLSSIDNATRTNDRHLDDREIVPSGDLLDICTSVNAKQPFPLKTAGCLLIQSLICQCRFQMRKTIATLVLVVDDVAVISDDLDTSDSKMLVGAKSIIRTLSECIAVLTHIEDSLPTRTGIAPMQPHFASQLRDQMRAIGATAEELLSAANDKLKNDLNSGVKPPASSQECRQFFRLIQEKLQAFGQHDFVLAVYSQRLLRLLRDCKPRRKGTTGGGTTP